MEIQQQTPAQASPLVYSPSECDEHVVAALCGVSVFTVRNWRAACSRLPYYKRGRKVVYKIADVVAFIDAGRVEVDRP